MPPLEEPVYFVDRSLGKRVIAERLRDEGIKVEVHDDHLAQDAPDEEWVRLAADRGWVALTRDKNIRHRSAEISAIRRFGASVIVIRMKDARAIAIAEVLVNARRRMASFVARTPPPFVAGLRADGKLPSYSI